MKISGVIFNCCNIVLGLKWQASIFFFTAHFYFGLIFILVVRGHTSRSVSHVMNLICLRLEKNRSAQVCGCLFILVVVVCNHSYYEPQTAWYKHISVSRMLQCWIHHIGVCVRSQGLTSKPLTACVAASSCKLINICQRLSCELRYLINASGLMFVPLPPWCFFHSPKKHLF